MSNKDIRQALEARLIAMPGGIGQDQTQFENENLEPTNGVPYQRTWLMPGPPFNYGGSSIRKRFQGIFQVDLCFPHGDGSGDVSAAAKALVEWFPQGLSLTANNVTTRVDRTPEEMTGRQEGDRWVVPVRVTYFANV